MNNITFTSRIRPVNRMDFSHITSSYGNKNFVDYPWTIKESVFSEKAYTKDIFDCSVLGLTDGLKVLLLHLCPTNKDNYNFYKIVEFIKSKINLNNPNLQGFLFGSKQLPFCPKSSELFKKLETFLEENKISYSKIKGGLHTNDIAYNASTDEWIIRHDMTENTDIRKEFKTADTFFKKFYNEVEISELDETSW